MSSASSASAETTAAPVCAAPSPMAVREVVVCGTLSMAAFDPATGSGTSTRIRTSSTGTLNLLRPVESVPCIAVEDPEYHAWRVSGCICAQRGSPRAGCDAPGRPPSPACFLQETHPCILQRFDEFLVLLRGKRLAVFLDYDGGCRAMLDGASSTRAASRGGGGARQQPASRRAASVQARSTAPLHTPRPGLQGR